MLTINTPTDFATALLASLGAPASPANLQAVTAWEAAEGGNWHNTARFNPLNTSLQLPGSVNYQTGRPGSGVQSYTSWAQGVDATNQTLTQSNPAYGYAPIVANLRTSAGTQALSSSVAASRWGTGAFAGGGSSGASTPATDVSQSLGGATIFGIPTTPPTPPSGVSALNPLSDLKFVTQFAGWSIFTALIFLVGMAFIFIGLLMLGVVLLGPVVGPAGELIPGPVGFAVGRLSRSGKGSARGAPARTVAAVGAPRRAGGSRSSGGLTYAQRQSLAEQAHEHRITETEHRASARRSTQGRPASSTFDEPFPG